MNLGDCYANNPAPGLPRHTWIILSDPNLDPDNILIANITTFTELRESILNSGDHETVNHKSCVNYADANVTSLARLQEALGKNLIQAKAPLRPEVLKRVLSGASLSDEIKGMHRKLLRDQELID